MAEDTAEQYHYPPKPREQYGLHGRIANTPARLVGYGESWSGDQCVLWAEGVVEQNAVFGESLQLRRRVEAKLGESRLVITDEVTNTGHDPTPHMLLYHVNAGFPVVDEGSRVIAPIVSRRAREGPLRNANLTLSAPSRGWVEEVYEHRMGCEPEGTVPVAIVNDARGLALYQVYEQRYLPYHFLWLMLGQGTYVVGIEPSTNSVDGRIAARRAGELAELQPGEQRTYRLELGGLTGPKQISAFERRVRAARRKVRSK
jgi:hypothetical protein